MTITKSKEKCKDQKYNSDNIKRAFKDFLHQPIWAVSDLSKNKLPIDPKSGNNASSSDKTTWATLEQSLKYCDENPGFAPALVLTGNLGITIIDLDTVRDPKDNSLLKQAQDIINATQTYIEISVSGRGLHGVAFGKKLGTDCRACLKASKDELHKFSYEKEGKRKIPEIEMYDRDKFITITGNVLDNRHTIVEEQSSFNVIYNEVFPQKPTQENIKSPDMSDEQIVDLCRKAKNADKFAALFDKGSTAEYGNDASSADMALASFLAFYSQNIEQIERIMRNSSLKRPKWDTHKTYLKELTITRAVDGLTDTYQGSQHYKEDTPSEATWENPAKITQQEDLELEFPITALPDVLKNAVVEVARDIRTDPALVALPGIGITSLMIGKKVRIIEKPGLKHHCSLLLMGVAESGERKSSCFDYMLEGIKSALDKEEEEIYKKEKNSVKAHNDLVLDAIAEVKKELKNKTISPQDAKKKLEELYASEKKLPPEPHNFGGDITAPRLFQKLYLHGGAYGIFSSDGRSVIRKILGKKDSDSDESIYIAGMWGDDLDRSRVGSNKGQTEGEDLRLRKPALTTCVFVQPDLWEDFSKDKGMKISGLIARVNLVIPKSQMGTRIETENDKPLDLSKIQPFTDAVLRLRKWHPDITIEIPLDEGATKARRKFYNDIEIEIGAEGIFEDVKDIATKATSIATRFALNFAALTAASDPEFNGNIPPITEKQWLCAQALEEYFLAQAIDSQRSHSKTGPVHMLQKVAIWLEKQLKSHKNNEKAQYVLASQRGLRRNGTENRVKDFGYLSIEQKLYSRR